MATSTTARRSTATSRNLQDVMRRYPLFFFFFIAYGVSWILTIPVILADWHVLPRTDFIIYFFFTLKSFGPALGAYIMIHITEGRDGWRKVASSLKQWRVGWIWYVFILLVLPLFFLLGIIILPGAIASFQGLPPYFVVSYVISFIAIFFGGGALGEEPGWRGFALPRMQPRYGALRGTLLLGVLWVLWHLPDFLTMAQRSGPGVDFATLITINFPIFFVMVMGMAVIFTWVFNNTRGSVFIAIVLHASINTFGIVQPLFTAPSVINTDLFMCVGVLIPALIILILTRGQLGYQPAQENR